MRYRYQGSLKADISFSAHNEVNLSFPNNMNFRMPSQTDLTSVKHQFVGEVEASDNNAARLKINENLGWVTKLLSQQLMTKVGIPDIELIEPINGGPGAVSTTTRSISGRYYVVRPFSFAPNANTFINTALIRLSSKSITEQYKLRLLLNYYQDAVSAVDEVKKFWSLYSILIILKGDRRPIDMYIQSAAPSMPLLRSDYNNAMITVTTAVRDSFSHTATFNDGNSLDIKHEIRVSNTQLLPVISQELETMLS